MGEHVPLRIRLGQFDDVVPVGVEAAVAAADPGVAVVAPALAHRPFVGRQPGQGGHRIPPNKASVAR
jgi:hypothetical protein